MAKVKKKATPEELFSEWWKKKARKRVLKIEKAWVSSTEMTYDIALRVFLTGYRGERWEPGMGDSLFCDLDSVIGDAYLAGKESVS